ncbi:unnamed protein product [Linum trigynum]|uniref:Uncharacterized protein n=1 Tax=Linum trigynum TaxID=586398 RepID=A0AAV2FAU3_9ROSI
MVLVLVDRRFKLSQHGTSRLAESGDLREAGLPDGIECSKDVVVQDMLPVEQRMYRNLNRLEPGLDPQLDRFLTHPTQRADLLHSESVDPFVDDRISNHFVNSNALLGVARRDHALSNGSQVIHREQGDLLHLGDGVCCSVVGNY